MTPWPCYYAWDGDVLRPLPRYRHRIEDEFVIGQTYRMIVEEERSANTHRHYFAAIAEAWKNLPEDLAPRFATAEHLRKWALIKCGYCDEQSVVVETGTDARRVMAFAAKMMAKTGEYGVVASKGNVVSMFTAQSQAIRAMDKKTFQESKQAVLELVAEMIGVTAAALAAEVKKQGFHDEPEEEPPTEPLGAPKATEPAPPAAPASGQPSPPAGEPGEGATQGTPKGKGRSTASAKAGKGQAEPPRTTSLENPKGKPSAAAVKAAADPAQARSDEAKAAEPKPEPPKPKALKDLKTAEDYVTFAKSWIDDSNNHEGAMERWEGERDTREKLKVPVRVRSELQSKIDHKFQV